VVMYKINIKKYDYVQIVLFFKYFFKLYYFIKTFMLFKKKNLTSNCSSFMMMMMMIMMFKLPNPRSIKALAIVHHLIPRTGLAERIYNHVEPKNHTLF
jgi:hypothetical protein